MRTLQITSAITFVSAWLVGLAFAAGGPQPSDSTQAITRYYADHAHAAMVAHILLDGVAGVALIALAFGFHRYFAAVNLLARSMFTAGIAAGLTSLFQAAVSETMVFRAAHGADPASIRYHFDILNNSDTVKITLLAIMIAAVSTLARRSKAFPGWLTSSGIWFAPMLALSGAAFPLHSGLLYATLELTLVGLLTWVIAASVTIVRRGHFERVDLDRPMPWDAGNVDEQQPADGVRRGRTPSRPI